MKYLVLSDVHGNLEALDAVLADAGQFDGVLFLGDLVGYGPDPVASVNRLRGLPNLVSLAGNHDWAALGKVDVDLFNPEARTSALWTREQLDGDTHDFLAELQPRRDTDEVTMAHASPRDPIWEYMVADFQGPPNFAEFGAPLCFVGHTHVPTVFLEDGQDGDRVKLSSPRPGDEVSLDDGGRRIINPGGVGQPRDGDPRAAYGIWDRERGIFTFRRVPYDVNRTQQKIIEAHLPRSLASRLSVGM